MRTLVIIPTYNELENIPSLIDEIFAIHEAIDILIVDDNSPDGTGAMAEAIADRDSRLHVIRREGKLGLGTAYVAGFRYGLAHDFDRMVEMDADFSHRPEDLLALLEASASADVVIGSRNVPGGQAVNWSPLRHIISKGGSLYARMLLGLPIRDCTSGYKCFTRKTIETLDLDKLRSSGFAFQVEVNYACLKAGLRFAEVPIVFPDRERGASKMSLRIFFEALASTLKLRLNSDAIAVRPLSAQPLTLLRTKNGETERTFVRSRPVNEAVDILEAATTS